MGRADRRSKFNCNVHKALTTKLAHRYANGYTEKSIRKLNTYLSRKEVSKTWWLKRLMKCLLRKLKI